MPVEFRVKVQQIGGSLEMVIPKPVADGLAIHKGDVVVLTVDGSVITVKKQG